MTNEAYLFWKLNRSVENEDVADQVSQAELIVLKSEPRSSEEACKLLDVLIAQCGIERDDKADTIALANLRQLMSARTGHNEQGAQAEACRKAA